MAEGELMLRILREIQATQAEHTRRFDAIDRRFTIDAQLAATFGAFSRELREIRRLLVDEHLAREVHELRLRVEALEDRLPPEAHG
jgi:hypothetical protein